MEEQQTAQNDSQNKGSSSETKTGQPDSADIEENKVIAAIGYLGILCLVPLLAKQDSAYAQHHGKQGLVIFIAWVVLSFVNVIPVLGQIVWVLGSLVLLILVVTGLINAINGVMWEAPVLGEFAKKINL